MPTPSLSFISTLQLSPHLWASPILALFFPQIWIKLTVKIDVFRYKYISLFLSLGIEKSGSIGFLLPPGGRRRLSLHPPSSPSLFVFSPLSPFPFSPPFFPVAFVFSFFFSFIKSIGKATRWQWWRLPVAVLVSLDLSDYFSSSHF